MKEVDVQIRRAQGLTDYQAVVELQKIVWSFTDTEDLASIPMLMIANRFGGAVLVAQESTGRFIGFSMANAAWTLDKRLFWWSHMTAVVEDYRDRNIGLRLKTSQRDEAIAAGIDEIRWTFDPLQVLNAHFNIHKLGVIVREYEENVYGSSSSPLHQGLPTDRFVAEWHVNSGRVKERLGRTGPGLILRDFDRMPRVNEAGIQAAVQLRESPLLLEVPMGINDLRKTDLVRARAWQDSVRAACLVYFRAGYTITDFILVDNPRPQALYVLENTL